MHRLGGRAVGTPGLLRMLEKLHDWQGKLAWADLFSPAIKLAEQGFTVSNRDLNKMLKEEAGRFEADVKTKDISSIRMSPTRLKQGVPNVIRNMPLRCARLHSRVLMIFMNGDISARYCARLFRKSVKNRGLIIAGRLWHHTK